MPVQRTTWETNPPVERGHVNLSYRRVNQLLKSKSHCVEIESCLVCLLQEVYPEIPRKFQERRGASCIGVRKASVSRLIEMLLVDFANYISV